MGELPFGEDRFETHRFYLTSILTNSTVLEWQASSTHRTVTDQYGHRIRAAAQCACLREMAPFENNRVSLYIKHYGNEKWVWLLLAQNNTRTH